MDDERLLAEALRAHAAGGVSTPGGTPDTARPAESAAAPEAAGPSRLRDRFRPLARSRRQGDGDTPLPGGPAIPAEPVTRRTPAPPTAPTTAGRGAPPMPRPAPGTPERPWPQAGPRPPARPVPGRPMPTGPVAHPGAPGVPHPQPASGHPTGATPAGPPPATGGTTAWTPARIAWWSGVALLAGAIAGALAAVGSLALPG